VVRLRKVLEQSRLLNENRYLRDQLEKRSEFGEFIGDSAAIRKIKDEIREVAQSDALVLIAGETGVGKELVARAIHRTSARTRGPFMDLNCAALPDESLFQSELFGHEKGAFTGAVAQKKGKLEIASGGTVFLDEISELSRDSQAKILKAIEQLEITRIGGNRVIQLDCRFICATNRELEGEVKAGRFRQDLYYRVNVFPIFIPPLRQRPEDVPALVNFFLAHFSRKYLKPLRRVDDAAMALLRNYAWPGNVRELRNIIERLMIRSRNQSISYDEVEACGLGAERGAGGSVTLPEAGLDLEEVEKQLVLEALRKTDWNQKDAAKLLNISVDRMNARVKKFNLKHPSWRVNK